MVEGKFNPAILRKGIPDIGRYSGEEKRHL
jgi:hypothetical protein